jgi:hypothetical protein
MRGFGVMRSVDRGVSRQGGRRGGSGWLLGLVLRVVRGVLLRVTRRRMDGGRGHVGLRWGEVEAPGVRHSGRPHRLGIVFRARWHGEGGGVWLYGTRSSLRIYGAGGELLRAVVRPIRPLPTA